MDVFFAREKIKKKKKFLNITVINAPNSFSSMKRKINSWACTKNPYDTEYQFFRKKIFRNSRMENIYQNRNNISAPNYLSINNFQILEVRCKFNTHIPGTIEASS